MSTFVRLNWPSLDISVRMKLLEDRAPRLCRGFVDCLPLSAISWHAVISGENLGFPLPLVWTDADNPSTRVPGSVFFYANGQLVVVPYGTLTEPGLVNVFGEIHESEFERLVRAGSALAESIMGGTGRPVMVEVAREPRATGGHG